MTISFSCIEHFFFSIERRRGVAPGRNPAGLQEALGAATCSAGGHRRGDGSFNVEDAGGYPEAVGGRSQREKDRGVRWEKVTEWMSSNSSGS